MRTHGLAVVADARIDNRDELIGLLGLRHRDPAGLGDAELILRSYQQWGEACPGRLLGDFAFAVWDGPRRRLFCARDHLGVKPLCYHATPGRLVGVASTPNALLVLGEVPYRLNEGRIADFLIDELEGIDKTSTFFEGVYRLPPAHTLTVTDEGIRQASYWSLEPGPELRLPSDAAYAEAFLEVFTEAVRCRLRNHGPTGSMLSGGMDSGAIVAVARELQASSGNGPLPTFSAVASTPDGCVETQAIHAALAMDGLAPNIVSPATWGDLFPRLDELSWHVDEPFDFHMVLVRAVNLAAHQAGTTVLLDGIDADNVLSEGSQLRCLLREGHWLEARREAVGLGRFWGDPHTSTKFLTSAALQAFSPAPAKQLHRYWHQRRHHDRVEERVRSSIISPAFARRVGLEDRLRTLDRHGQGGRWRGLGWQRARALDHPYLTVGVERYDRVASSVGIEPRHPFLDRRLIAFCLTLPGDQKLADGWPKAILRRAMAGRLPDAVRWRRGKEHLGWIYTEALVGRAPQTLGRVIEDNRELLEPYVDIDRTLRADSIADPASEVPMAAQLALWLADHDERPRSEVE